MREGLWVEAGCVYVSFAFLFPFFQFIVVGVPRIVEK